MRAPIWSRGTPITPMSPWRRLRYRRGASICWNQNEGPRTRGSDQGLLGVGAIQDIPHVGHVAFPLAVVLGAIGVMLGFPQADPIIGITISAAIIVLL